MMAGVKGFEQLKILARALTAASQESWLRIKCSITGWALSHLVSVEGSFLALLLLLMLVVIKQYGRWLLAIEIQTHSLIDWLSLLLLWDHGVIVIVIFILFFVIFTGAFWPWSTHRHEVEGPGIICHWRLSCRLSRSRQISNAIFGSSGQLLLACR